MTKKCKEVRGGGDRGRGRGEGWGAGGIRSPGGKALGQQWLVPNACWEASKPQSIEPQLSRPGGGGGRGAGSWGPAGGSSLAEVDAEDWAGEGTLLQQAL